MKHKIQIPTHSILLLVLITAALLSCKAKKPITLAEQLTGDWEVTSWTHNGAELMKSNGKASTSNGIYSSANAGDAWTNDLVELSRYSLYQHVKKTA